MKIIDSTYLRTIHDGLLSGAVNKDNASALPIGLVGMYEEALPPGSNVYERRKLLDFLTVWALLKKEVSAGFVSALLEGWTEDDVLDFISRFSKWFNSPVGGTYVLYHERLRAFVVEKASHAQFLSCNEALIQQCEAALLRREGDEWERYALEYLSAHMLLPAMELGDAGALRTLAYNTAHWNRQVEISKGFGWTKRMLNDMELWASKYDEDEVIECLLNKVDLHHIEQNDGPRIVALVAQNDIDTALQRIESFGGNDEEGLKRKFLLYMLCLMELTLLDSKDAPFRKEAIGRLLKHLDDNLPVDHSVLDWNTFFSSYLMFSMACEWAGLGLDYMMVYKRTDDWEKDWLREKGPYNDVQFEVLLACAMGINSDSSRSSALGKISIGLVEQGKLHSVLTCARRMCDDDEKSIVLTDISIALARQGKTDEAASALEEAVICAMGISSNRWKSKALRAISTALAQQGKVDAAASSMREAISCARGISDDFLKSSALKDISMALAHQCKADEAASAMQEALTCALAISDGDMNSALKNISAALAQQGKADEALSCAMYIRDESHRINALKNISTALVQLGKVDEAASAMQEALTCARGIPDGAPRKSSALEDISTALAEQGKIDEAATAIQEALTCARAISQSDSKSGALKNISFELARQGKEDEAASAVQEALTCAKAISDGYWKSNALKDISAVLAAQGKADEAASAMQEALTCAMRITDWANKINALRNLATEYAYHGQFDEALKLAKSIPDGTHRCDAFDYITIALAAKGKVDEAASALQQRLHSARGNSDDFLKFNELADIAIALAQQGKVDEALICAMGISDESFKIYSLRNISHDLGKQGKLDEAASAMQEALTCARGISDDFLKSSTLKDISIALDQQGKVDEAVSAMQEALTCARGIPDESDVKSRALKNISIALAQQGKVDEAASAMREALTMARNIPDELHKKSSKLNDISTALVQLGKVDEAASAMQEALTCARGIPDGSHKKSSALKDISTALAEQGKIDEAATAIQEALTCAMAINNDSYWKSSVLADISTALLEQSKLDDALTLAREIPNESHKSRALMAISIALAQQGNMDDNASPTQEALTCAWGISDDGWKSRALKGIATALAKKGNWGLSEKTALEIPSTVMKNHCWEALAKNTCAEMEWQLALLAIKNLEDAGAKAGYLRGMVESLRSLDCRKKVVLEARCHFKDDIASLEKLLHQHALRQLFFEQLAKEKIERFNRTLNLQWAVEVKNGFKQTSV